MLCVSNCVRRYGQKNGFGPISFEISKGSIAAFVGRNGAGKTTLLRVLAGIEEASSGQVLLNGEKLELLPRTEISYLADNPLLLNDLTLKEMCEFDACMRGVDLNEASYLKAIERFGCEEWVDRKIGHFSLGMKKRAGLTCAFLGEPQLIILDEPINGLDIHGVILLKHALLAHKKSGGTIIMSCHVLSFLKEIDAEVYIMKRGLISSVEQSSSDNLEEKFMMLS
ncbi:MAG: ABC transporter ATP-binding protein [Eggerthellaceae bacterium]|nr:ABC transporter ATP-binding protein [Eggerthellaceae bacterium]